MTKSGRHLPKDVVEHWPEVFSEVHLNVIPLDYLQKVLVNFTDGKSWEIQITADVRKRGWPALEEQLTELLQTYEDNIENVDFKLDTRRVRQDIEKSTQKFFRKKKLQ